jgi:hypothetical protein
MPLSNFSSVVGLLFQKEGQLQALWAVYTAVQLAEGDFGLSEYHDNEGMPLKLGLSVLLGVWAFNFGHMSLILSCIRQNERLEEEIRNNPEIEEREKTGILRIYSVEGISWRGPLRRLFSNRIRAAVLVHLFIDVCASVALMSRSVEWPRFIGLMERLWAAI